MLRTRKMNDCVYVVEERLEGVEASIDALCEFISVEIQRDVFNLWRDSTEELSWENLRETMMSRLGGGRLENPFEELKELKQTSSMEEYIAEFKLYSS
ncbi:hypothetical protein KIW84_032571 [Lathyrus oleraceus]|uniref:Retrotransposon gag domain-containing protein n=1 Tax=Pisum sativum TaxID=3888 RepID=A0A9D4XUL7_PEA|nr:hypothetical protein KIW84_032571 [Pisum sativum]